MKYDNLDDEIVREGIFKEIDGMDYMTVSRMEVELREELYGKKYSPSYVNSVLAVLRKAIARKAVFQEERFKAKDAERIKQLRDRSGDGDGSEDGSEDGSGDGSGD